MESKNHSPSRDIIQERIRQARWSFNLSLATTATAAVIGIGGVGLLYSGKAPMGTVTTTGGVGLSILCLRLAKDANDRLDKLAAELDYEK